MRVLSKLVIAACALGGLAFSGLASAQSEAGFREYLRQLRPSAIQQGVSPSTFDRVIPSLQFTPSVIRIDRQASGGGGTGPIPRFTGSDEQRAILGKAQRGREVYRRWRSLFDRIERETGVSPGVILAIYGKESNYGGYMGRSDVPSALATLAYEGRRRSLFEPELIASLQMIDRGVPRSRLSTNGSWAGAMGRPQFLPSVYLRLARDGDGDGDADIWGSEADAFASIAAYLQNSGWRRGEPWGIAVNVPPGFDRSSVANRTTPTRCRRVFERHSRWMSMAEWRALGFRPRRGVWPDDNVMATLLEPDFQNGPGYLLTQNYRAILDYNCSNFYAMAVGLLADEITQ